MAEKNLVGIIPVVDYVHYKKQDDFVLFLLNSKCDFVSHLDKYLTSFSLHPYYDQKMRSFVEYVPSVCYTDIDKVKEFLVVSILNNNKYSFEDMPGDASKTKSIQLFDIKSYEQSSLHKAILKAVEKNEKERNASL